MLGEFMGLGLGKARIRALLFCALSFVTFGCTQKISPPGARPLPEEHHAEMEREARRFSARVDRRAEGLDVLSYDLNGEFDWAAKKLRGQATLRFKPAPQSAQELVLESRVQVEKVVDASGSPLAFSAKDAQLVITLKTSRPEEVVTIHYLAEADLRADGEASAITSVAPRKGDPLNARVVYTTSEPEGASMWMPCHNDPRDRARFSARFEMPANERLISNGNLVQNDLQQGKRVMRYATAYTLPTYLMAFAVGEFEVYNSFHGNLPVSIWTRKGLPVDAQGVLSASIHDIAAYERLVGRYPFEKYVTVLLPEFPAGGIEHASITFQTEDRSSSGSLSADRGLSAHELGHQWFGDYVTIESWDDLWIKEGMATLLAEEASRDYEDANRAFRLFGRNFDAFEGEAIRDPELGPEDKYTSGPYGRSAWLLTQLRALVGEQTFWSTLRGVLQKYAFGSIGTEGFLAEFAKVLDAPAMARFRSAIAAKALPKVSITDHGESLEIAVTDPQGALVVPLELDRVQPDGRAERVTLATGASVSIPKDEALWVLEPRDVQAIPYLDWQDTQFDELLLPRLIPTEKTRRYFVRATANAPLMTLGKTALWTLNPRELETLYAALGSEEARYLALQLSCKLATRATAAETMEEWKQTVLRLLARAPFLGLPPRATPFGLSACRGLLEGTNALKALENVASYPETPGLNEAQLVLFSLLDQDAAHSWRVWSPLALKGPSVRFREVGLHALTTRLNARNGYATPSETERDQWLALLREKVGQTEVTELQRIALAAILDQKDLSALPALAQAALQSPRRRVFARAVCVAYQLTKEDAPKWQEFLQLLGTMPAHVKAVTEAPAAICPSVW